MTFFAFVVSVLMGAGSLAFAYFGAGYDGLVRSLVIVSAFWLYAGWRRWPWASTGGILIIVALAGYGLWKEFSPGWMIAATLGGLLAWDLSEFMRRMDVAPDSADLHGMQRRHIARLTIVAIVGLLIASIAMFVRLEFTLEWMMLLSLLAVLGITQLVAWLRRS